MQLYVRKYGGNHDGISQVVVCILWYSISGGPSSSFCSLEVDCSKLLQACLFAGLNIIVQYCMKAMWNVYLFLLGSVA
jgi:hypothetical protein